MNKKPSNGWVEKINRSAFFFVALLLHLAVFLLVATWVVLNPDLVRHDVFDRVYVKTAQAPPPPLTHPDVTPPGMDMSKVPFTDTLRTSNHDAKFQLPETPLHPGDVALPAGNGPGFTTIKPSPNGLDQRLEAIRKTVTRWMPLEAIPDVLTDVHNLKTKPFPVYLAIYANGDWSCNNYRIGDEIKAGCLPNLVAQMKLWSKGNLTTGEIKPIRIDSPDLLADPPPFIFFTGHRDFTLTDSEIENLREYLQVGGAIWGDSAFAGDGSRFDVAFHREMKRVLPDADKNFEPLSLSHEIFTHSYFPISKVAVGMNYRADPIEVINLDGKVAVIYTPNDYSDMMTLLLKTDTESPQVDVSPQSPSHPLFTPAGFMASRGYFFRNYDPQSASEVYRLSTNIIVHLLTRFDDELEMGH